MTAAVLLTMHSWLAVAYPVVALIALNAGGEHRLRICLRVGDEIPRLAAFAALPVVVLLPWIHPAIKLAVLALASVALLPAMRAVLYATLRSAHRHNWLTEPALIVGTDGTSAEICRALREHADLGLRPVGFLSSLPGFIGRIPSGPEPPMPVLGGPSDLATVVVQQGVSRIIVSSTGPTDADLVTALRANRPLPVDFCVVPRMHELAAAIPAGVRDDVWGIPLIPLRACGPRWSGQVVKRTFDLIIGTALLMVCAPLLLLLALAVWLRGGRPVLFRQVRVTRAGGKMQIAKFRTITAQNPDAEWTVHPEQCTSLSRLLRSTHLDELPQLVNVVRGQMSLVGPRPERPHFTSLFAEKIPRYEDRHRVHSGLTGWAQVHGLTGDTSIDERVRFDNYYIENWSLWLDMTILVRTLAEPLVGLLSKRAPEHSARPVRGADRPANAGDIARKYYPERRSSGTDGVVARNGQVPPDSPSHDGSAKRSLVPGLPEQADPLPHTLSGVLISLRQEPSQPPTGPPSWPGSSGSGIEPPP